MPLNSLQACVDFVRRRLLAEALRRLTAPSAEPQRRGDGIGLVLVVVQLRLVAAGPECLR